MENTCGTCQFRKGNVCCLTDTIVHLDDTCSEYTEKTED